MLTEAVDALDVKAGGIYVDGTLGRAGHSKEILRRGGSVIGIDRDDDALSAVESLGIDGLKAVKGNHGDIAEIIRKEGLEGVDGILLDLGVSSPQLDEGERGFSFRSNGPLDMRMDRSCGMTAADLVRDLCEDELAKIFRAYGEEPQAKRIAKAIVKARASTPIATTLQLAEIVERTVGRRGAHHPATRVFQALRMHVNDEIGELEKALTGGLECLKAGGRMAVITFESLTDRIVKRFFAAHAGKMVSLQQGGERWEGSLPRVVPVTRKAVTATDAEISANARSRSAKLRVVERLAV
ncbi:MAG: 16S rRNA (cytosine(1402)-N(4))-methyltransferase RsmH [Kiritimatiellae bacterium]|nr:16S rRNA (cytosine(1402)-N(4))-methyltransferase RsmH [Kiritimatiellia bacterium]